MNPRRSVALALLGLYALVTLGRPALHLLHHDGEHTHLATGAIDWTQLRTPDGHVDLEALARRLGLASKQHQAAHQQGEKHEHPEKKNERPGQPHGDGASEHFGLALLTPTVPVAPLLIPEEKAAPVEAPNASRRSCAALFLTVQRAQAPPIA